jgi:hypothetical protein
MKVHLIRIAALVLAVVSPLLATPAAARPKDPNSFLVTPVRQGGCNVRTSFGDPPRTGLCPAGSSKLAANQPVSQRPGAAQSLLRNADDAIASAGSLQYTLEMRTTTTNIRGGSWTAKSTLVGDYAASDRLRGVLTIANPWSKTQSQVVVADGEAYVAHPQTGVWEKGLQLATSYYPVIFAGCLIRMAAADTDSLVLLGTEKLDGESVFHLAGPGGFSDELELEYWLGVEDGLPRQAAVRTRERPGWSDEAHTIRITATLRLSNYGTPAVIEPPTRVTS